MLNKPFNFDPDLGRCIPNAEDDEEITHVSFDDQERKPLVPKKWGRFAGVLGASLGSLVLAEKGTVSSVGWGILGAGTALALVKIVNKLWEKS